MHATALAILKGKDLLPGQLFLNKFTYFFPQLSFIIRQREINFVYLFLI